MAVSGSTSTQLALNALFNADIVAPSWVMLEELMLRDEIVPIGAPDRVRLVFFFDC